MLKLTLGILASFLMAGSAFAVTAWVHGHHLVYQRGQRVVIRASHAPQRARHPATGDRAAPNS